MFSRPKILFLVSLLFVALLNSIPTYLLNFKFFILLIYTSKYKKLLISKRRIGILKKLPKQGEDSESL